ncbi:NAD(P)-binding domain-containing protein [Methanohalophilus profundi]|uniref:NAD(P)-binding domain-containing protein n=1 Tax=Methanohalophilus profundi TaxID=2138083 RepID=UPI00101D252E|nr:NAD(P)-binding domain-containing protein [Methanohalophilus profundi]
MRIAILGGTGNIGKGFALRWGQIHDIIIGSRDEERAKTKASEYNEIMEKHGFDASSIKGTDNKNAAAESEIVVLAIRYSNVESIIEQIKPVLKNQIVVSVVVPMEKDSCYMIPDRETIEIETQAREDYKTNYFCYNKPPSGSAAEEIAAMLPPGVSLVSAFHNVPAAKLADLDLRLDYDIGVCGNDMNTKKVVFDLVRAIPNMNPVDVGPCETSLMVESLTPLLINIAVRNQRRDIGIKFVD